MAYVDLPMKTLGELRGSSSTTVRTALREVQAVELCKAELTENLDGWPQVRIARELTTAHTKARETIRATYGGDLNALRAAAKDVAADVGIDFDARRDEWPSPAQMAQTLAPRARIVAPIESGEAREFHSAHIAEHSARENAARSNARLRAGDYPDAVRRTLRKQRAGADVHQSPVLAELYELEVAAHALPSAEDRARALSPVLKGYEQLGESSRTLREFRDGLMELGRDFEAIERIESALAAGKTPDSYTMNRAAKAA
jgi:hypothetical protein